MAKQPRNLQEKPTISSCVPQIQNPGRERGGVSKCHHNDVIAFIIETMEQEMESLSTQFPGKNEQVNWN